MSSSPKDQRGLARTRLPARDQIEMRCLSLDQMIAADHRVRTVWAYALSCDLSSFYKGIRAVEGAVGRNPDDPTDIAHDFTHAPRKTPLEEIVQIAGRRWTIEECFEQAKQLTGLDEYEVRSWIGWHRHITLSTLALAMLVVIRAAAQRSSRGRSPGKKASPN